MQTVPVGSLAGSDAVRLDTALRTDPLLDQLENELRAVTESLQLKPYAPVILPIGAGARQPEATPAAAPVVPAPAALSAPEPTVPVFSPTYHALAMDLDALTSNLAVELDNHVSTMDPETLRQQLADLNASSA